MRGIAIVGLAIQLAGCVSSKSRAQLEREWFECGLAATQAAREQGRVHDAAAVQDGQDGCFAQKNPKDAYQGTTVRREF